MDLIRNLSPAQKNALNASKFFPNLLVFVDWPGDPLYFNMSDVNIVEGGQTYLGFGPLAGLSLPPETEGVAAESGSLSIIGVDADLGGRLNTNIRGRAVRVSLGFMSDQSGGSMIGASLPIFRSTIGASRMITTSIDKDHVMNTISVDLSTGPSARSASSIYHTDEDQRKRYPTDTAGRLLILARTKAQKLRWPE